MLDHLRLKRIRTSRLNGFLFVFTVVLAVFFPRVSPAQDKIFRTDSTIIESKVQEVGDAEIRYKKFSNLNGPVYVIKKADVWKIVYENGEKEVYNQYHPVTEEPPQPAKQKNPQPHHYETGSSLAAARDFILSEEVNDAIASYFQLIRHDSANVTLLAEDAYALALGGIYDGALVRLDRCWILDANTPAVNYFTAQVLSLMGYDDLGREFWKPGGSYHPPDWIASRSAALLQKFRSGSAAPAKESREELIFDFKRANDLAGRGCYFQSMALFHKLVDLCPGEYILYAGYSTVLEKVGAIEKSIQAMEKAISLVSDKEGADETKHILEQRLVTLRKKAISLSPDAMPGLSKGKIVINEFKPQLMAYFGGMAAQSMINVNGRAGYYITGSTNAAFDLGVSRANGITLVNLGLTGYYRKNVLVVGGGLMVNSGGGSTSASLKISAGISKLNKQQTSSFDVFIDGNVGLGKNSMTTVTLSVGQTIYFGKKK